MSLFNNKRPIQQSIHRHSTESTHRLLLHPDSGVAKKATASSRTTGIYQESENILDALVHWGEEVLNTITAGMFASFLHNVNDTELYVDVTIRTPQGKFVYYNLPLCVDPTADKTNATLGYIRQQLDAGRLLYVKLIYDGGKPTAAIATGVMVGEPTTNEAMKSVRYDNGASGLSQLGNGGYNNSPGAGITDSTAPPDIQSMLSGYNNKITGLNLSPEFMKAHNIHREYLPYIQFAAQKWTVSAELILAILLTESSGDPTSTSSCGAEGLMQIMPTTFPGLYNQLTGMYGIPSDSNPYNPQTNIYCGSIYLANVYMHYGGDLVKTIASFNAGQGAVDKYNGVPPYAETQNYVRKVSALIYAITNEVKRQSMAPISSRIVFQQQDKTNSSTNTGRSVIP